MCLCAGRGAKDPVISNSRVLRRAITATMLYKRAGLLSRHHMTQILMLKDIRRTALLIHKRKLSDVSQSCHN